MLSSDSGGTYCYSSDTDPGGTYCFSSDTDSDTLVCFKKKLYYIYTFKKEIKRKIYKKSGENCENIKINS